MLGKGATEATTSGGKPQEASHGQPWSLLLFVFVFVEICSSYEYIYMYISIHFYASAVVVDTVENQRNRTFRINPK